MTAKLDRALVSIDDVAGGAALDLSRDDRLLYVELNAWACAMSTDGYIPRNALPRITDHPDPDVGITALVKAGMVERDTPRGIATAWQIANFADNQLSADWKRRVRKKGADRQRAFRDKTYGLDAEDGKAPDSNKARNGVTAPSSIVKRGRKADGSNPTLTVPQRSEGTGTHRGVAPRPSAADAASGRSAPRRGDPAEPVPADALCWVCGNLAPDGLTLVARDNGYYSHPTGWDDAAITSEAERAVWRRLYPDADNSDICGEHPRGWVECSDLQACGGMVFPPDATECPGCGLAAG